MKVEITSAVEQRVHDDLVKRAEQRGLTPSELIAEAVAHYLYPKQPTPGLRTRRSLRRA